MTNEANKRKKSLGRKPKNDKSKFRYTVNLNSEENDKFKLLFERSGLNNISRFLNHVIFKKEIKVVKIDKATMDYCIKLTEFYYQFQRIGNNYNQIVQALKTNFSEKRALSLLYQLEKATINLIVINEKIIRLTEEFKAKYLGK